jgi:hypothetical protein
VALTIKFKIEQYKNGLEQTQTEKMNRQKGWAGYIEMDKGDIPIWKEKPS